MTPPDRPSTVQSRDLGYAQPNPSHQRWGRIILILSLLAIASATLFPTQDPLRPLPTICIFCGDYGGIDFTLNIILFVPYGIGLYLALGRPWRGIAIAALTTLTIELLQLSIITGRDTSLGDLIANTLGATIGIFLTRGWRTWILPEPGTARRLSWSGLCVWIAILCLSGWALQPSPTSNLWFGQAIPELAQFGRFRGTLLSASLDGQPLPTGAIPRSSPTYTEFKRGRITIDATVTPGWRLRVGTLAPIVSAFDAQQHEIFFLGQRGLSLVFRSRTRTTDLRMREPTVGLPNVFPHSYPRRPQGRSTDGSRIGDTIQLSSVRTRAGVTLTATSPIATRSRVYPFHVFLLWNSILPFDLTINRGVDTLSALWAIGLILLPAYWFALRRDPRSRVMRVLFGSISAVSLVLVPRLFGLQVSPWWAWLATALGIGLGYWLARFAQQASRAQGL